MTTLPRPPTPAEARDQAAADLDAARDRAARLRPRRSLPPPPEVRLERPSLRPPAGEVRLTERELQLGGPPERPVSLDLAPAVADAAALRPGLADLAPAERRSVVAGVARILADDAVDKTRALLDFVGADLSTAGLRDMIAEGLEEAMEVGLEKALEFALEALFGEPLEPPRQEDPFGDLEEPPPVERLDAGERRFFVQLPSFPLR